MTLGSPQSPLADQQRTTTSRARWLVLTAAGLCLLATLGCLVPDHAWSDALRLHLDQPSDRRLDDLVEVLKVFGRGEVIIAITLGCGAAGFRRRALDVLIALLVVAVVVTAINFGVGRVRPNGNPWGFPSGDVATIAATIVPLCLAGRLLGGSAIALTIAVAVGRVLQGYHYPSDVMAAIAIGLLAGALAHHLMPRISGWLPRRRQTFVALALCYSVTAAVVTSLSHTSYFVTFLVVYGAASVLLLIQRPLRLWKRMAANSTTTSRSMVGLLAPGSDRPASVQPVFAAVALMGGVMVIGSGWQARAHPAMGAGLALVVLGLVHTRVSWLAALHDPRVRPTLPGRLIAFGCAGTSLAAFIGELYGWWPLREAVLWVMCPALSSLAGYTVWRLVVGASDLAVSIAIGAATGVVAAMAYDLFRLPFVLGGMPLFAVMDHFGELITAGPLSTWSRGIGWAYHASNGITIGIMYVMLAGTRRHWGWAVVWAVGIEVGMLLSPYSWFVGVTPGARFVAVTLAAHIVFGATLGRGIARSARRFPFLAQRSPVTPGGR